MKPILHALAMIGVVLGLSFLLCYGIGMLYSDPSTATTSFLTLGTICLIASVVSFLLSRKSPELSRRDALIVVLTAWLFSGFVGAAPYLLCGVCTDVSGAIFESFSGLTTTGASVLTNLESLPRSLLFWRSFTHFLGGIGILIVFIAILPFVGAGGVQLYNAESTGLLTEKLTARIAGTARIIVGVYLILNSLCAILLRFGGLTWYDSVCHAFGTIATGGFSTRTDSIAAFHSPFIEWVIIVFMFVSGVSFVAHYRALTGNRAAYLKNSELHLYALLTVATAAIGTICLVRQLDVDAMTSLRMTVFQTVSLFSTTGFTTADYDIWPSVLRFSFLILMVIGACAGSTSGAIKSVRVVVAWKVFMRQLGRIIHPSRVQALRLDGNPLPSDRADKAVTYIVAYLLILAVATLTISLFTSDSMTAVSSVIACLGGVGPGMGGAGPTETYAEFPGIAKLVLVFCMLLGRLEIYICLAAFMPSFWKNQ